MTAPPAGGVAPNGASASEFDQDLYFSNDVLVATAGVLFNPTQYISRIIETIDMRAAHVVRRTRFDVRAPGHRFLFPIAFASTDRLVDLLRVDSVAEGLPAVLGRIETARVLSAILLAQAATVQMSPETRPLVEEVCELLPLAGKADATRLVVAVRERFRLNRPTGLLGAEQDLLQILFQLCGRRPLLVPVTATEPSAVIVVERDLSALDLSGGGAAENIRFAAAREPQHLRFSLDSALWTRSYHFELHAPDGYYTSAVECSRRIGSGIALKRRVRKFEIERLPKTPDANGIHADPRGITHVQLRNCARSPMARNGLLLDLRLKEQPVGDLGSSAALVWVMFVSTLAVATYAPFITAIPTQSFTTLIAALPGLLAATVLFRRGGVTRGPLAAQVGSALGALSAVSLSVVLAIWTATAARERLMRPEKVIDVVPAPFGLQYVLWSQAVVLCLLGIGLAVILVRNVIIFSRAVSRHRSRLTV